MDWRKETGVWLMIAVAAAVVFGPSWLRPIDTCVAGDSSARLAGQVPESWRAAYLDAAHIRFGLGSGAIGGWESLGEALAFDGWLWLRTTHRESPNYYRLVRNRYFQTNAFVYVPAGRESTESWDIPASTTAVELWEQLAARYPYGVLAAGELEFARLRTIAIAVPAIHGEEIRRHAARYYTRPLEDTRNARAFVVALVAGAEARRALPALARALPPPPAPRARSAALAHALRLDGTPPQPRSVGQVLGDSVIARGALALYPVRRLGECPQAVWKTP